MKIMNNKNFEQNTKNLLQKFIFFGTDDFSVIVLNQLFEAGFIPSILVTAPDRPAGRGQKIQEPPVKIWGRKINNEHAKNIEIIQPEYLDMNFISKILKEKWSFFVTASYGKIIPNEVLEIPEHGAFNVHPSLLPLYRGASPVESVILDDNKETGVTIMLMDEKMDHGPILNQELVYFNEWPTKIEVEERLAEIGGKLLTETITLFLNNELEKQDQDHEVATFTKKITKEMGEVKWQNIKDAIENPQSNIAREIFIKTQALNPWPGVFFFIKHEEKEMRVKIKKVSWTEKGLKIQSVLPEGKKEMKFEDFLRGYHK